MASNKMKAVVCTKYGPPEVLKVTEVKKPVPADNEVRIKIFATAVTVGDSRVRSFNVPPSFWLPARLALGIRKPKRAILGSVFAGEVESTGRYVKLFKTGDKVFGSNGHRFGAYTEYLCMPENGCVAVKPSNLTYEESAAIPWGGITALHFLKEGNINKGQKVLIYGASGAVGTSAVQLAKYFGAEVTGVCSSANLDLVKSIGADNVIDYLSEDFTKNGKTYDIIFDTVGKSSVSGSVKSLKKGGVYLHAVVTPALGILMLFASIAGGKKITGGTFIPKAEDLIFLKELAEAGHIKPVIDRIYPPEQIVEAHRYVDTGHKKGNVVIKF